MPARLLSLFTRADGPTGRCFGGTGLALAVCRLSLQAMDGTIEADSEAGAGTVFRVEVRLGRLSQSEAGPLNSPEQISRRIGTQAIA